MALSKSTPKAAQKLLEMVTKRELRLAMKRKAETDAGTDWLYGWHEQLNKPQRVCASDPNHFELGVVVPKTDKSENFVVAKFGNHMHKLTGVSYTKANSAVRATKQHSQPGPLWEGEHYRTQNTLKISQRWNKSKLVLSFREQQRQRHQVVIDAFGPVDTNTTGFLPEADPTLQRALGVLSGLADRYAKDKLTIEKLKAECNAEVKAAKAMKAKATYMKAEVAARLARREAPKNKAAKPMKVRCLKKNTMGENMKNKIAARLASRKTPTKKDSKHMTLPGMKRETMATAMKKNKIAGSERLKKRGQAGACHMDDVVKKRLRMMPKMHISDSDSETSEPE